MTSEGPIVFKHFLNKAQKINWKGFLELRQKCLLIYKKKDGSKPQLNELPFKIIYLGGLYVDTLPESPKGPFGFSISHKSPTYGVYQIEIEQLAEFDKWKLHIRKQKRLLQDNFLLTEEVLGKGRFSVVHKGLVKKRKEMEVAIKIIEREELKKEEEEILK